MLDQRFHFVYFNFDPHNPSIAKKNIPIRRAWATPTGDMS
jgi:hypothetical protein